MAERNPVHHTLLKRPSVMVNSQLCLGSDQRLNLVKCTFGDLQNAHTEHTHTRAHARARAHYPGISKPHQAAAMTTLTGVSMVCASFFCL